jgi:acetyl-CoA carboxylase biotin carboxyl carrier protein
MADKKSSKRTAPGKNQTAASAGAGPMDVALLQQLVSLMAAHDLNTVDLRDGNKRVVLKRGAPIVAAHAAPPITYATPAAAGLGPFAAMPQPVTAGNGNGGGEADEDKGLVPIKSPMVGTFYTAAKPGEKPFVGVGSRVVADETDVCVIEAMKNFFVQKADVSGTIVKVLVENGQPVQVEQPMFLVRPD